MAINREAPTFEKVQDETLKNGPNIKNGVITFPILPFDHVHKRRRLESSIPENEDDLQVSILHQGYGTHYVDLWVGSPKPQRRTVIIDTGSQITAFPCMDCQKNTNSTPISFNNAKCVDSDHFDSDFNRTESQTFQTVPCDKCSIGFCSKTKKHDHCEIRSSYVEGSNWMAYEATDIIYLGNAFNNTHIEEMYDDEVALDRINSRKEDNLPPNSAFHFRFACQTKISLMFKKQLADGIMGLNNEQNSFWHQIYKSGVIAKQQFSVCLAPKSHPLNGKEKDDLNITDDTYISPTAGVLAFGGIDETITTSPVVFSKMFSSIFYTVQVRNVYLQKATPNAKNQTHVLKKISLDADHHGQGYAIVDSGATETYLCNIKGEFEKMWEQMTGFSYRHEFEDLTEEQISKLPTIIFQLSGLEASRRTSEDMLPGYSSTLDKENPFDVLLIVPPHHYIEYSQKTQKYVSRIVLTSSPTGNDNILGSNILQGYNILFDMENFRIGWALSSCDYSKSLNTTSNDISFNLQAKYTVARSAYTADELFLLLLGIMIFISSISIFFLRQKLHRLVGNGEDQEYELTNLTDDEEKLPLVVI